MRHIPALDGIRAIAVTLVLCAHFNSSGLTGAGTVGVDLFFVLSGFLITSILLEQWLQDGRIHLRSFYWRRVLRLWPALALLLTIYAAAAPLISTVPREHLKAAMAAALSYMNWNQALAQGPEGFVGHAWSLSIEEQFYLVWPSLVLVLLRFGNRKTVITVLAVLLVSGIAWRGYVTFHGAAVIRIYAGTDTHADGLLIGCLLAAITLSTKIKQLLAQSWGIAAAAIITVTLIPAWSTRWFLWEFAANGMFGAWLIMAAAQERKGLLVRALSAKPMTWLGRRSYGIYLWHVPVIKALVFVHVSPVSRAAAGIPLSLAIAAASYRFLEEPFLRLKKRAALAPHDTEGATLQTSAKQ